MANENFPGNPYTDFIATSDPVVIAIRALAFEMRTANLLEMAKPTVIPQGADPKHAIEALREAAMRLGRVEVAVHQAVR